MVVNRAWPRDTHRDQMKGGGVRRSRGAMAASSQTGDVITRWLFQILAITAVIALIVYELLAVVVTNVSLDDNAHEVARAARDAYRGERSLDQTMTTAEEVAATHGVTVTGVAADGDDLVIDLEKRASTLLVHRIGPLEDLATATTSRRIQWTS
jgi:hypothetical protein